MSTLYPVLLENKVILDDPPTAVVSCAQGELHELGARMVSDFLELDGWNVHFFGANMPSSETLEAVEEIRPDVVFLSVTMLFHVRDAAALIARLRERMPARPPWILVGGYPFKTDDELWRKVGADGSAADAEDAAELGARLLKAAPPRGR
jgi:methanogenic corrinoid protein MtbC1